MTPTCQSPLAFEVLVAYWADDLESAESDRVEEHFLGCAACTAALGRVSAVAEGVRSLIPPIISREGVAALRARGARIVENPLGPGERKLAVFPSNRDILLHRLGGLHLADAARVDVTITVEETGDALSRYDAVPFDREAGEVLVACQRHFRGLPPNIVIAVRSFDAAGHESVAEYPIPHVFE